MPEAGGVIFSVQTGAVGAPAGADSCIATVPPALLNVGGEIHVQALGRVLRTLSTQQAERMGEVLHHADWTVTADPEVVERVGMGVHPGCPRCRASVDQALALLAEHPTGELLVGVLYWAAATDG